MSSSEAAARGTGAEPDLKLEMRGITKRYPGVVANDHIDLDLRPARGMGEAVASLAG